MANNVTLSAAPRGERGKGAARRLRASGRIPAVVYGRGEETRALSVDAHEMDRLFSGISVENTVIDLAVEGQGAVRVLVREVQSHPYRPEMLHVDFYQVHAGQRVAVEVPVRLVGSAEGVKAGGVLDQRLHVVDVRCLPDRIPEVIEADISALGIGGSLHVRDLVVPAGVDIETDPDRAVCGVAAPTVQALEEEAEEPEGVGGEVEPELVRERGEEEE